MWIGWSLSLIWNEIHRSYFSNCSQQLLTELCSLFSGLLSHSVSVMCCWATVMQATCSVTKQRFKSNPVQSHLCHWEIRQKTCYRQQCSFPPGFALNPSNLNDNLGANERFFSIFRRSHFQEKTKVSVKLICHLLKLQIWFWKSFAIADI